MKTTFTLLALAATSLVFSSCCSIFPCAGSLSAQKEVTTFNESQRTVYGNKSSYVVTDRVPVTSTQLVKDPCTNCGSSFDPYTECCGIVSKQVLSRATAQGSSGEPGIGLIPTMKNLPISGN